MKEPSRNNKAKASGVQELSHRNIPPSPAPNGELLTLREARKRYGVSVWTMYRLASLGEVHAVKPSGRILYPDWELRRVFKEGISNQRYRRRVSAQFETSDVPASEAA